MKSLLVCVVLLSVACSALGGGAGGQTALTDEELKQQKVLDLVENGVAKLQKEREGEDSSSKCLTLKGVALSGTKQVVAGTMYRLKIHLTPSKVESEECKAVEVSLGEEVCMVKVWLKLPHQGKDHYYIDDCEPVFH